MSSIRSCPQPPQPGNHPNIYDRLKFRAFVGVIEGASMYRRHETDVLNTHVMGWVRQLEILGEVEQSWWLPPTRAAICVCLLACEGRIWRDDQAMKLMLEHIRVKEGSSFYSYDRHEQLVREAVLANLPSSQEQGGPYIFATAMEVAVQKIVDEEITKCHSIEAVKRMNNLHDNLLLLAEEIRGMNPNDLDKWLEEQHRRVLFRCVLEDELIKELTEIVARGNVTCQPTRGEDEPARKGLKDQKWPERSTKEVKLSAGTSYHLGKTTNNESSIGDGIISSPQFVSEHEKRCHHHTSPIKTRSDRKRNDSMDETESSCGSSIDSSSHSNSRKKNKSPSSPYTMSTVEDSSISNENNTPSNSKMELKVTSNSKRLKSVVEETDEKMMNNNTQSTPKRDKNAVTPSSERRMRDLTSNEIRKETPSNSKDTMDNTPSTRSKKARLNSPGKMNRKGGVHKR